MNKTYILQKDLPNVKAGTKFELNDKGDQYVCVDEAGKCGHFCRETVETKPDWFIEEKPERIEVMQIGKVHSEGGYYFNLSKEIPNEDNEKTLLAIKEAIEKILNKEPQWYYKEFPIVINVEVKEEHPLLPIIRNLKTEAIRSQQFDIASKWRDIEKSLTTTENK